MQTGSHHSPHCRGEGRTEGTGARAVSSVERKGKITMSYRLSMAHCIASDTIKLSQACNVGLNFSYLILKHCNS